MSDAMLTLDWYLNLPAHKRKLVDRMVTQLNRLGLKKCDALIQIHNMMIFNIR